MASQRIIERWRSPEENPRYTGRTEPPTPQPGSDLPRTWAGATVEHVVTDMNRDLGVVPDAAYQVREG